ncbi:hypothetical protein PC128_g5077 [Phytophthora cactorum]|nr:hypothetical protein PC120_g24010 [Phytophthora cactorum]KAG3089904.1 hypothetical protein PC121_g4223 [Phytophthora cactorum]KAG3199720.1 hypothetical protein PC128_g5077 [Phytophthora cactorum]
MNLCRLLLVTGIVHPWSVQSAALSCLHKCCDNYSVDVRELRDCDLQSN